MHDDDSLDQDAKLRQTRIVIVALALGVVLFAAIAAWIAPVARPIEIRGKDVLAIVAVCISLQALPLSFVVRSKLVKGAREREPAQRAAAFRASSIVAAALCEAAALSWCIAILFSGNLLYLGAVAVVVAVMLLHLPTREAFEDATGLRAAGA